MTKIIKYKIEFEDDDDDFAFDFFNKELKDDIPYVFQHGPLQFKSGRGVA